MWKQLNQHPDYEINELGEIRKIGKTKILTQFEPVLYTEKEVFNMLFKYRDECYFNNTLPTIYDWFEQNKKK